MSSFEAKQCRTRPIETPASAATSRRLTASIPGHDAAQLVCLVAGIQLGAVPSVQAILGARQGGLFHWLDLTAKKKRA
ncbi:hypothetical protein L1857_32355 [Amycolatopsis thermalba]|uniref:Uncharacterized protein n=1 Tax=Amycolatopsis thermalba TaxID=944492 RepID=A0ABY4P7C2_9PSEU|nr:MULTISPECIES: hypothetical protein [Amycolatopsis]UQS28108.1 hypothetical protein L1857_32355 [Amycolatopsis thermalba]